jgi:malonate-semialdehyde dehydrogenase (acetylating)/methylmalonate-semialdehyde dehydrogenase
MTTTTRRPDQPVIGHVIGGVETTGDATRFGDVFDPAVGEVTSRVVLAEASDVDAAVAAARQAFPAWRDASLSKRTAVLFAFRELVHAHIDELAAVITAQHGKTLPDAKGEVQRGLEVVEFACGIGQILKGEASEQVSTGVDLTTLRQPLGVVVGITPFNFPVMVPMWMHPVAIACGNTFVLKPSERDPGVSNLVARLWQQAGLPDGVFNVVHGDIVAVQSLLAHPDVAAVSFVGSTPVARIVQRTAIENAKRVQALGGAKNHAVVLPDADLDFAAGHITAAGYGSAGQRCMAVSAVVAVGDIADALVDRLAGLAGDVTVGPGNQAGSDMGPVVTADARERITGLIASAAEEGAELVTDGRGLQVRGNEGGFFVGPTLVDRVTTDMRIYSEEVFGPVLVVLRVETVAEALAIVDDNPFGNGVALFTSSGFAAREFVHRVKAGMVGVNVPIPVPMAYHSFGGWKDSMFGDHHIHGMEGVRFYTRAKAVTTRWPAPDESHGAAFAFPTSQ